MKKLRLKKWVKVVLGSIIICGAIISTNTLIENVQKNQELEESKIMVAYINCLQDNFTQRDYCSKQVSSANYLLLDQKLEKYGYKYIQKGYDLYLVNINK